MSSQQTFKQMITAGAVLDIEGAELAGMVAECRRLGLFIHRLDARGLSGYRAHVQRDPAASETKASLFPQNDLAGEAPSPSPRIYHDFSNLTHKAPTDHI